MINNTIKVLEIHNSNSAAKNQRWSAATLARFCELAEIETGEATTNDALLAAIKDADSWRDGWGRRAYFNLSAAELQSFWGDFDEFLSWKLGNKDVLKLSSADLKIIADEFSALLHYADNLFVGFESSCPVAIENQSDYDFRDEYFFFDESEDSRNADFDCEWLSKLECYSYIKEFLQAEIDFENCKKEIEFYSCNQSWSATRFYNRSNAEFYTTESAAQEEFDRVTRNINVDDVGEDNLTDSSYDAGDYILCVEKHTLCVEGENCEATIDNQDIGYISKWQWLEILSSFEKGYLPNIEFEDPRAKREQDKIWQLDI